MISSLLWSIFWMPLLLKRKRKSRAAEQKPEHVADGARREPKSKRGELAPAVQ